MKTSMRNPFLLLAVASMLLGGCAGDPVRLNAFPAKEVALESGRPVSGEACGFQLLLFIPIMTNSRLERAMERVQIKAGSDSIANLSVEESWWYGFVGTTYCTKLEATAYKKTSRN